MGLLSSCDSAPTTPPNDDPDTAGATVNDQRGQPMSTATVSWKSTDPTVTVTGSGEVTGEQIGTATVVATSGTLVDSAIVSVTQVPAAVALSRSRIAFDAIGKTESLTATVQDAGQNPIPGVPVAWSSSNDAVATVDDAGLVTSKGGGTATIAASAGSTTQSCAT